MTLRLYKTFLLFFLPYFIIKLFHKKKAQETSTFTFSNKPTNMLAQTAPYEVLVQIFLHLRNRTNLLECTIVCQSWSTPAIEALHQKVLLNDMDIDFVRKKYLVKQFVHTATEETDEVPAPFEQHGKFVKQLSINDTGMVSFGSQDFITLMSYLPHLKIINLKGSDQSKFYLFSLQYLDSNTTLTQLEKISSKHNPDQRRLLEYEEAVFMACLNFSSSLKQVNFHYREIDYMSDRDDSMGDMLHFLPQFINLTHLTLENSAKADLTSFDLLKMFPNLIKLKYKSIQFVVPHKVNEVVQNLLQVPQEAAASTTLSAYYGTNLQKLHLTLPIITKAYIKYIIHCLPKLKSLKLFTVGTDLYDWMDYIGQDLLQQFYQRLKQINNVEISCNTDIEEPTPQQQRNHRTADPVRLAGESTNQQLEIKNLSSQERVDKMFQLLNSAVGDDPRQREKILTNCNAVYAMVHSTEQKVENSFKKRDNSLNIYCTLVDPKVIPQPTRATPTMFGPEIITKLTIMAGRDDGQDSTRPRDNLKYALSNYPRLQYLRMLCFAPNAYKSFIISGGGSNLGTYLSSSQENLRKIQMSGGGLTNYFLDVIAEYLPDIEVITCGSPREDLGQNNAMIRLIMIDLTRFTQLKRVAINVTNYIDHQELHHIYIQFQYAEGEVKPQYYDIVPPSDRWETPGSCKPTTRNQMSSSIANGTLSGSKGFRFRCSKKIDEFILCYGETEDRILAEFRSGELQVAVPFSGHLKHNFGELL